MMFKELKSKNVQNNSLRYYIRAGSLTAPPVFAILRRSAAVLIAQHSARRVTQPPLARGRPRLPLQYGGRADASPQIAVTRMHERHTTDFTFTPRSPRQPSRRAAGRPVSSRAPWWPEWRHCSAAPWCVSVALGSRTSWLPFTSEVGAGSDATPDLTPFQFVQLTSGLVRLFRRCDSDFRPGVLP